MLDKSAVDAVVASLEHEWALIAEERDRLNSEKAAHEQKAIELEAHATALEKRSELYLLDPEEFNQKVGDVEQREKALADRAVTLDNQATNLAKKETALDEREKSVVEVEDRLTLTRESLEKRELALDKERSEYKERIMSEIKQAFKVE